MGSLKFTNASKRAETVNMQPNLYSSVESITPYFMCRYHTIFSLRGDHVSSVKFSL